MRQFFKVQIEQRHGGGRTAAWLNGLTAAELPDQQLSPKWLIVWKVEGFAPEQAERLQRWLARETGADPAGTDCARVLRLPRLYNHKYAKPHFVSVEALSERRGGAAEDFVGVIVVSTDKRLSRRQSARRQVLCRAPIQLAGSRN